MGPWAHHLLTCPLTHLGHFPAATPAQSPGPCLPVILRPSISSSLARRAGEPWAGQHDPSSLLRPSIPPGTWPPVLLLEIMLTLLGWFLSGSRDCSGMLSCT